MCIIFKHVLLHVGMCDLQCSRVHVNVGRMYACFIHLCTFHPDSYSPLFSVNGTMTQFLVQRQTTKINNVPSFCIHPVFLQLGCTREPLPSAVQCYSKIPPYTLVRSSRKHLKPAPVYRFNNNSTLHTHVAHNACTCMAHACTVMVHGKCKPIATRELHEDKLIEKCLFEIMIVATHWSGATQCYL